LTARSAGTTLRLNRRGFLKRSRRPATRPSILAADLAAAAGYLAAVGVLPSLTGTAWVDGALGVVLGLAIGSHPATNFLDMLIYWRVEGPRYSDRRRLAAWIALNALVLAAAGGVIGFGATRFTVP
jgi:hypothetical protein